LASAREFDSLRVVLVGARNPLNIGAAARAMSNFGFTHLRLVAPYDLAFREARSAAGASAVMQAAEVYSTVAEAIADCTLVVGTTAVRHRELRQPLHRLEEAAPLIRSELASGKVALLFGSEKFGLSTDDLSHCHWLLRVPTREEHISMNLGQAVAVCMYELARDPQATQAIKQDETSATAAEVDRVNSVLMESLEASGYVNPRVATSTEEKVRRLLRRMRLTSSDAELLLGMLRQILWKLGANDQKQK
jgi:TrmH family RNA methyltransferase